MTTKEIMRFNALLGQTNPEPHGLYVRYEDHLAALAEVAAPAHPAEGAPAGEREAFEQIVKETMHGAGEDHIAERLACWPDGTYKDRSTGYAWWAWQRRAALVATPAAPAAPAADALDAARYRWLRERDLDTLGKGGVFAGMTPDNVVLNGNDLDSAIDAARAAQGGA